MTLGLDGTIFTVTQDGYLHSIDMDGNHIWKVSGPEGFMSSSSYNLAISPDGMILYSNGLLGSFFSISTIDGTILWQIPYNAKRHGIYNDYGVMVDNEGFIYHNVCIDSSVYFSCIEPSGQIKWHFSTYMTDCVMDWDGFIYAMHWDTLYSLDHIGQLRWKRKLDSYSDYTPILCDGENVIYVETTDGWIYAIDQRGDVIFKKEGQRSKTNMGAIDANGHLYYNIWFHGELGCHVICIK